MEGGHGKRKRLIEERRVCSTPWWDVYNDRVRRADGSEGSYIWATTNHGACLVLMRTPRGRLVLIRVYRYPLGEHLWECVAGQMEAGEAPEECARREMLEETGVEPLSMVRLGSFVPISGFTRDRFHVFLAEVPELEERQFALQEAEGITAVRLVEDAELRRMVAEGEVVDGGTLTALGMLWARR